MSKSRIQREQRIAEAEGYLDLIVAGGGPFVLDKDLREKLALKALSALAPLEESVGRRAHVLHLIGQAHRLCHRYEQAIAAFESSLDYDANVGTYLSLGWCYKRSGNLPGAITCLEDALEVEPSSGIVNYNLACYWALANNPKSAIEFLSRAFEMDNRFRDLISEEPDFDLIRNHPEFQAITTVIV